jgi:5-methylcytosine-specific restriction endonuclease McrA
MNERQKTRTNSNALVLNQGGMPIDVIPWEDSIIACVTGKAIAIAEYDDLYISTGYNAYGRVTKFRVPSVIQKLTAPVDRVQYVRTLPPTRENLLRRDRNRCCYCKSRLTLDTATIEHVHPESKGGLSDWANCRVACSSCNRIKGDKLLSELGWQLDDVPIPIVNGNASKSLIYKLGGRIQDESWRPYITWEVKWH